MLRSLALRRFVTVPSTPPNIEGLSKGQQFLLNNYLRGFAVSVGGGVLGGAYHGIKRIDEKENNWGFSSGLSMAMDTLEGGIAGTMYGVGWPVFTAILLGLRMYFA